MQDEIDSILDQIEDEVRRAMEEAGKAAVAYNIANGDYKDRTGHLRASNYYEVTEEGLEIGNSADYAEFVESKGYMVCSGGALLAEKLLNGN